MHRNNNGNKSTGVNISNYYSINTYRIFEGLINNSGTGESKEGMDWREHQESESKCFGDW